MLKVEIELDENKLQAMGRDIVQAHGEIREYFGRYPRDITEITSEPKTLTFKGLDTEDSWADLWLCISHFGKQVEWFKKSAGKLIWYNSDDGRNEEDFVIENVLEFYLEKGYIAQ